MGRKAMPSLILNPWFANAWRTSLLSFIMASFQARGLSRPAAFDNLLLNREKVEWSGEGLSIEIPKNFLNDILSFIWFSSSESDGMPSGPEALRVGDISGVVNTLVTSMVGRPRLNSLRIQWGKHQHLQCSFQHYNILIIRLLCFSSL